MHIVAASDDNYSKYMGVMLASLLENLSHTNGVNIYVIDGNISQSNKLKLKRIVQKYNLHLHYLKIDDTVFRTFNKRDRISKEAYYRILIPNLLDKNISKALYLDCDVLIMEDITKLWETNINNYFLAAVESSIYEKLTDYISLPYGSSYFNSGVMLLNLDKWREHQISEKVIEFKKNNPHLNRFVDQDALNAILYDKWLKLHYRWNYTTGHLKKKKQFPLKTPAILHFTTKNKPWNSNHPYKKEYLKYLHLSNWDKD